MATWYVDLEASSTASGNSFANRTSNLAGIVNSSATGGDEVRVMASGGATAVSGATFTNLSTIAIPANTVKVLYNDGAWTAGTNVTAAASTTRKQGATSTQLSIQTAFTTGIVGYFDTGVTNNLSGYKKICFWFRSSVAIANASIYTIRLCSDALGATPVNTLTLPAVAIAANTFVPIVLDNGSALSSTVRSISLFVPTTDPGVPVLLLDNLMACNDVTLRTLISKNNTDGPWFGIRSITNDAGSDTVTVDMGLNSIISTNPSKGFYGTTESTTAYVSDGISLGASAAAANTTSVFNFTKTAPAAFPISVIGGWDRTNMSTSGGYTHINGFNGNGRILSFSSGAYLNFQNFIISTCYTGVYIVADNLTFDKCHIIDNVLTGFLSSAAVRTGISVSNSTINSTNLAKSIQSKNSTFTNCNFLNSATDGISLATNTTSLVYDGCTSANNTATGLTVSAGVNSANITFKNCNFNNNTTYGLEFLDAVCDFKIINGTFNSNGSGAISTTRSNGDIIGLSTSGNNNVGIFNSAIGNVYNISNWVFNESTPISNLASYDSSFYTIVNYNGVANDHRIVTDGGTISSDTSVRYSATGISWKLQPTSTTRTSTYPLVQPIKGVPVKANVAHTVSIQARRSSTSLTLNFGMDRQTVAGLTAQEVSLSATADTWQQLSISFTPTADAVIDFYVSAYGGTNLTGYWDEFVVNTTSRNVVSSGNYGYYDGGVYVTSSPLGEFSTVSVC